MQLPDKVVQHFWRHVEKADGCWSWRGTKTTFGYGQWSHNNQKYMAHRVSYTLAKGPIPEGLHILHACDNPSCANPAHLSAGTRSDNRRDCLQKGRANLRVGDRHYKTQVGSGARVFIKNMRDYQGYGDVKFVAAAFKVAPTCIYNIQNKDISI